MEYDKRHGGPWDRGSADSYYGRAYDPHYYIGETGKSTRLGITFMSLEDVKSYDAGWLDNENFGNKKEWG